MGLDILVDLDGVLADFEAHRFRTLSERGLPALHPHLVLDFYGTASYTRHFGQQAAYAARAVTTEVGFFRNMPPVPGALEGVRRLREDPRVASVRVCSKPLREHPNCTAEKLEWVHHHLGLRWASTAIITHVKSEVVADVNIDDRPHLLAYTAVRGEPEPAWTPVVFSQPWNLGDADAHRMEDWNDFDWLDLLVEHRLHLQRHGRPR